MPFKIHLFSISVENNQKRVNGFSLKIYDCNGVITHKKVFFETMTHGGQILSINCSILIKLLFFLQNLIHYFKINS